MHPNNLLILNNKYNQQIYNKIKLLECKSMLLNKELQQEPIQTENKHKMIQIQE
jgi:hypothetical protein